MFYPAAQTIKHHLFNTSLSVNLETILKNELFLMSSKNTPHFYYFMKCCTFFFTDDTSLSLNGLTYLKKSDQGKCFYTFAKISFYFTKN